MVCIFRAMGAVLFSSPRFTAVKGYYFLLLLLL